MLLLVHYKAAWQAACPPRGLEARRQPLHGWVASCSATRRTGSACWQGASLLWRFSAYLRMAGCVSLARGPACATGPFTVRVVLASWVRWGTSLFFAVQRMGAWAAQAAGQGLHPLAQPGELLILSVARILCSQASTLFYML